MDDLISRAAAIAEVEEYLQGLDSCISEPDLKLDGYRNGLQVAIQELKALPAVDAVPVIRCRDCKHSDTFADTTTTTMPLKCLNIRYGGVYPDWYCEHGERRDSE